MNAAIEQIQPYVLQVATPYATGTGFYAPSYDLIITNYHVVQGNNEVIVKSMDNIRSKASLVYVDFQHDLALLRAEDTSHLPSKSLGIREHHTIGDHVIALGHPYGLSFTSTYGIIANTNLVVDGVSFLMHDAALNPGNSGGPLISKEGEIIGVNTSIIKEGKSIGVALKTSLLVQALEIRTQSPFKLVSICSSCHQPIDDHSRAEDSCLTCGAKAQLVSKIPAYKPTGISLKIEEIISRLHYDPTIARRGQYCWEVEKGSATITLTYHPKSGYILAESILCNIPQESTLDLYIYLLETNYKNKDLTFSVKGNNILLSILIYDKHLHSDATYQLLDHLIQSSDHYDDILIDKFGAKWN